jgi:dienelactone hydrolase
MYRRALHHPLALISGLALIVSACGNADTPEGTGGAGGTVGGTGSGAGQNGAGSSGVGAGTGGSSGGSTGGVGSGGMPGGNGGSGAGGASGGSGASAGTGGTSGTGAAGGAGKAGSTGGATAGGTGGTGGAPTTGCTAGPWPAADPAMAGPFTTVTETDVGPMAGVGEEDGELVAFTMFRPQELGRDGACHPVITWGNGSGSNPGLYGVLLRHLASHGFVVIASDSPSVATGDPPPMLAGVTWVIEQSADPASPLYGKIDAAHVGATGHSLGGFATSQTASDSRMGTIAPVCGAANPRNVHGPAFLICGGQDEVVPCSGIENAFDSIDDQPALFGNYVSADHADWVTFRGSTPSPVEVAVTAWMRVHLMGDTALRSWFYGPTCKLCTDSAWAIQQKMMDE